MSVRILKKGSEIFLGYFWLLSRYNFDCAIPEIPDPSLDLYGSNLRAEFRLKCNDFGH